MTTDWMDVPLNQYWQRFQNYLRARWQETCRTLTPKEILTHMALLTIVLVFLSILTYIQPALMGLTIILFIVIAIVGGLTHIAYKKLVAWVTQQCNDAKTSDLVVTSDRKVRHGTPHVLTDEYRYPER